MIFRFLGGVAGSAFLSIGGGTISDLFTPDQVATYVSKLLILIFLINELKCSQTNGILCRVHIHWP